MKCTLCVIRDLFHFTLLRRRNISQFKFYEELFHICLHPNIPRLCYFVSSKSYYGNIVTADHNEAKTTIMRVNTHCAISSRSHTKNAESLCFQGGSAFFIIAQCRKIEKESFFVNRLKCCSQCGSFFPLIYAWCGKADIIARFCVLLKPGLSLFLW